MPAVKAILAGTCTTLRVSLPVAAFEEFVWIRSPPPNTFAVFDTLTAEVVGTLTIRLISGKVPPAPATTAVEVQVTAFVPEQLQPLPVNDDSV